MEMLISSSIYENPKYYEIAFSFRDIAAEVDVLEDCFKRFSRIPVKSVLELACGNCPHMKELISRGYRYSGIDLNETMVEYSRKKALESDVKAEIARGDMVGFFAEEEFDFIYVMLGSLFVKNTNELKTHFASVASSLKKGGLYFLDGCITNEPLWMKGVQSWEIIRDGIKIRTTVSWALVDRVEKTVEEYILLQVNEQRKMFFIAGTDTKKAFSPDEFRNFIEQSQYFELVGWWNNWDLTQPLGKAETINRPIVVIRKL
ncbi:MAG: methyltransferase domain-containing protein [bacterium]